MKRLLPELGSGGWLSDPQQKLTLLFGHALASDASQSNIYDGAVTSIPDIIARYQNDVNDMVLQMDQALTTYYSRYFDSVIVISSVDADSNTTGSDDGVYTLSISIEVVDSGKTYSLAVSGQLEDSKMINIIKEVNR